MFDKILIFLVVFFWIWGWILLWPISKLKSNPPLKGWFLSIFFIFLSYSMVLAGENVTNPHETVLGLLSTLIPLSFFGRIFAYGFNFALLAVLILLLIDKDPFNRVVFNMIITVFGSLFFGLITALLFQIGRSFIVPLFFSVFP